MAISIEGGSGRNGRRRPLTADLNLVPYIDLLTCMVAFLLITAVWTQLARIEVAQHGQGEEGTTVADPTRIAVVVHDDGFTLVVNDDQKPLLKHGAELDYERLGTELAALRKAHPDVDDARVMSEDQIPFDTLVRTMDTARSAGYRGVSLLEATTSRL